MYVQGSSQPLDSDLVELLRTKIEDLECQFRNERIKRREEYILFEVELNEWRERCDILEKEEQYYKKTCFCVNRRRKSVDDYRRQNFEEYYEMKKTNDYLQDLLDYKEIEIHELKCASGVALDFMDAIQEKLDEVQEILKHPTTKASNTGRKSTFSVNHRKMDYHGERQG